MSKKDFQIAGDQLTAADHAKCLHKCGKQTGEMLKCQHLISVSKLPCDSIVHATCVQSLEPALVPYLSKFYCSKCCTANSGLREELIKIVADARQALAKAQISPKENDEIQKLQLALKRLQTQLATTTTQLEAQLTLNDNIQRRFENLEAEKNELKEKLSRSHSHPGINLKRSLSEHDRERIDVPGTTEALLSTSSATIDNAAHLNQQAEEQRHRMNAILNSSSASINDFNRENLLLWPDYRIQEQRASELSEMSLSLLRSSIAKPLSFQGDVTTWAIFLSDFKRTSSRGHYREVEDMERLRELIKGQALNMFCTELSDPYAEPIKVLRRLDEFYGVRGNAVRVSLDRVLALARIERVTDMNQLMSLYVNAKSFAHQCRANGKESELTSPAVLYIMESKMHPEQGKSWRLWAREQHEEESVDGIVRFLEERIRELHIVPQKVKVSSGVHFTDVTGGQASSTSAKSSSSQQQSYEQSDKKISEQEKGKTKRQKRLDRIKCFKCKEHHPFWKCPVLIKASDMVRMQIVDELHICVRCLSSTKHEAGNCPNKLMSCYVPDCNAVNKHPLLHGHPNDKIKRFTEVSFHNVMNVQAQRLSSHYGMIPGHVVAKNGNMIPVTILLDSGSGISLSTRSLFVRSGLKQIEQYELSMKWTSETVHVESNAIVYDIPFVPYFKKEPILIKGVTAIDDTSLNLPEQQQDSRRIKEEFPYLLDVPIPSYSLQKPQILLGLPHMGLMAHASCITGPQDSDPVAILTKLGWSICGTQTSSQKYEQLNEAIAVGFKCVECNSSDMSNDALFEYFRHFNSIDNMGIAHKDATLMSSDDQKAQSIINDTMKFDTKQNRYEIGLLWRPGVNSMRDNYEQAINRLQASEKRLKKLDMEEFVNNQFEEQIKAGWLVETTREEASKFPKHNYVYGFIVFNVNKNPPKPRWVNDTAAKVENVSLNSLLLKGPDNLVPLQQTICAVRESRIAYQADVKSMFNQIMLRYEDQFSQLCLWRGCVASQPPQIYRQTRMIFGPTCSPASANAVRIDHAKKCQFKFPEASDVALHQMYVDDVADSRDTIEDAAKVANQLIEMFDMIGWPLVEFYSNNSEFLKLIPKDRLGKKAVEIGTDSEHFITKILGLFWKPNPDVYVFCLNDDEIIRKCRNSNYKVTKREVLGIIMRVFDPLGLITPFRIRGMMIMQHIWRTGTNWKEHLDEVVADEFNAWVREFDSVTKLQVPRCYIDVPLKECDLSLHVFVDAGSEAYAACVYLRAVHKDAVYVRLIAAKGRVAPLKYMSIPKLELMSGVLGARLLNSVKTWHRRLKIEDYVCWTDSITSYKWIKSPHLPRTQFTAPRISEIQELTSADKWRYVPTKLNVADFGTKLREMNYSDANHEWYVGPEFLYEKEDKWPSQPPAKINDVEASRVFHVSTFKGKQTYEDGILSRVSPKIRSDWSQFTRVVAIALRFVDRISRIQPRNYQDGEVTSHELYRAENFIIRFVQEAVFPDEYARLSTGRNVDKNSKILALHPFMCQQTRLIRATTRLSENFPLDQRQPPILPNFHETSDTIAKHFHKQNLHVNDSTIIGAMRTRVWVTSVRRTVRRIRARCPLCIVKRAKAVHPDGSTLPDFRLDIANKPFYYTGCDLFGPYETYVKRSRHKETIYVVIFTCLVTRAVYYEVLNDMSTNCFLVALDKLWARRGPIAHIYSDNGRNFTGAAKVIEERMNINPLVEVSESTAAQNFLSEKRITWHFTPPYTPQFGGTWERLIRDTKRALDASLGKFTVPRTTFEAVLAKIETNMNNRPLTDLPVSPKDQVPLTPYLLMQGYPNYPMLDEGCSMDALSKNGIVNLKAAERINALVQTYRSRFVKEYAPVITRTVGKGNRKSNTANKLKVDDVVIYLDPTLSTAYWPRGIISKIYKGPDKKVRVVDVRLSNGKILERRSAYRVAKLDFRLENSEAEQDKYDKLTAPTNSKNLTVAENSNPKLVSILHADSEKFFPFHIENSTQSKMSDNLINSTIYDDDVAPDACIFSNGPLSLSDKDKTLYLDFEGRRTVVAENIPPNLGASEIFQIFERFGTIVTIRATSFDGVRATRVMIVYSSEFAALSATNYNESQLIIAMAKGYVTKISLPIKKVKLLDHKSAKALITMTSRINEESSKILFITNKRTTKILDRTIMPSSSGSYGYVHSCVPEQKFPFTDVDINVSDLENEVAKLPRENKIIIHVNASNEETIQGESSPGAANETSSRSNAQMIGVIKNKDDSDSDISLFLREDPFTDIESEEIGDLRDVLNARAGSSSGGRLISKLQRRKRRH